MFGLRYVDVTQRHSVLTHVTGVDDEQNMIRFTIQHLLVLPCLVISQSATLYLPVPLCLLSTLLTLLHVSKSSITLATTVLGNHGPKQRVPTHTLQSLLVALKSMCWCVELRPIDL